MKTADICIPCMKKNIDQIAKMVTDDPALQAEIISAATEIADNCEMDKPPPYAAKFIQRTIKRVSGNPDPYTVSYTHLTLPTN